MRYTKELEQQKSVLRPIFGLIQTLSFYRLEKMRERELYQIMRAYVFIQENEQLKGNYIIVRDSLEGGLMDDENFRFTPNQLRMLQRNEEYLYEYAHRLN